MSLVFVQFSENAVLFTSPKTPNALSMFVVFKNRAVPQPAQKSQNALSILVVFKNMYRFRSQNQAQIQIDVFSTHDFLMNRLHLSTKRFINYRS